MTKFKGWLLLLLVISSSNILANAIYDNGAKVGISTETPIAKLHIKTTDSDEMGLHFENNSLDVNFLIGKALRGSWPGAVESDTFTLASSGSHSGNIAFGTGNTERMRIAANGKVGIGTTNPQKLLQVSSDGSGVQFDRRGHANAYVRFEHGSTGVDILSGGAISLMPNGTTVQKYRLEYETFRINGPKVLIGASQPSNFDGKTAKLTVKGLISAADLQIRPEATFPDYVFDENYKLTPLNELKKYIQKQKHLPGIPSAKEVAENGLSVGNMQVKFLEKIEELTLHMINQQEMLEAQAKEIQALKTRINSKN